jgi:hypothetical protein
VINSSTWYRELGCWKHMKKRKVLDFWITREQVKDKAGLNGRNFSRNIYDIKLSVDSISKIFIK